MINNEYTIMYELEDSHWWFKGKRKIVFSQLDRHLTKKDIKILDIGCGTGIMMKNSKKYGKAFGIDIYFPALKFCAERNLQNLTQGDISALPFKSESFDAIGVFDVLYHKAIKDDVSALLEIRRILKKGGILAITDSADMKLWSRHDIAAHARERYSMRKLSGKLEEAKFKIRKITYFNTFLYPLIYCFRKFDNMINKNIPQKSNIEKTNPIVNFALYCMLVIESFLIKYLDMPFGVSILAIAEK